MCCGATGVGQGVLGGSTTEECGYDPKQRDGEARQPQADVVYHKQAKNKQAYNCTHYAAADAALHAVLRWAFDAAASSFAL
jgi:hypothetical protein